MQIDGYRLTLETPHPLDLGRLVEVEDFARCDGCGNPLRTQGLSVYGLDSRDLWCEFVVCGTCFTCV